MWKILKIIFVWVKIKLDCLSLGFPQKQVLRQRFQHKYLIWKMILEKTDRGIGKTTYKDALSSELLLWSQGRRVHSVPLKANKLDYLYTKFHQSLVKGCF